MSYAGFDPGLDGGIALVGRDGVIVEPMPTLELKKGKSTKRYMDVQALIRWLKAHRSEIRSAVLEQPGYRPGQSTQSGATVGRNFGIIEGVLAALGIPYEIVTPQAWMKDMHQGIAKDMDSKSRSLLAVSRLFPGMDLRRSERCKNPHDGMAEALLLAEWQRRRHGNA